MYFLLVRISDEELVWIREPSVSQPYLWCGIWYLCKDWLLQCKTNNRERKNFSKFNTTYLWDEELVWMREPSVSQPYLPPPPSPAASYKFFLPRYFLIFIVNSMSFVITEWLGIVSNLQDNFGVFLLSCRSRIVNDPAAPSSSMLKCLDDSLWKACSG